MHPPPPVKIYCKGHPNIRASHGKTFELTRDSSITSAGTCIIGVEADYDEKALLSLRGSVQIDLACGGIHDRVFARMNPKYTIGAPLIFRRMPEPEPRTVCIGASKSSLQLDREMISALQKPGAVLEVTLQQDTDGKKDVTAEGILYLVGTPIGNMDDLSPRALSVLKSVDRILCEDTRITREFLSVYGIDQKLISCHDHNEREKTPDMISRLQDGARLALVSDAGMPLISDPGFHLVRAAREADIHVTSVPGPDAVTTALSVAGLPPDDFRFMGFLPRKPAALRKCLENIAAHPYTTVVYESAHRIEKTLNLVLSVLPHREMALCRNLTKFGEKVLRGSAADILSAIQSGQAINGELVLIIEGAPPAPSEQEVPVDPDMLNRMMETLIAADLPTKPLGDALAKALNIPRREGFNRILDLKRNLIN